MLKGGAIIAFHSHTMIMTKKMTLRRLLILLQAGLVPVFAPVIAHAAEIQSLRSIRDAAETFVLSQFNTDNAQVEIIPVKLDPRLRLSLCDQPLDAELPSSSRRGGRLTVNVKCNGTKPWTLYVPVQVKVMQDVVVLSHSLSRNSIISQSDLKIEQRDINRMTSGYFSDLQEVIGKTLKRSVGGGLALSPSYVESQRLVKRGQQVILLAQTGSITVKMAGKAMANGGAGERIKVKNLSSNRVIEGVITEEGVIRTQM